MDNRLRIGNRSLNSSILGFKIFFRQICGKGRERGSRNSSLKLNRSLWVRKRESFIFSVCTKFQKPMSFIRSIFSPFISAKDGRLSNKSNSLKEDIEGRKPAETLAGPVVDQIKGSVKLRASPLPLGYNAFRMNRIVVGPALHLSFSSAAKVFFFADSGQSSPLDMPVKRTILKRSSGGHRRGCAGVGLSGLLLQPERADENRPRPFLRPDGRSPR